MEARLRLKSSGEWEKKQVKFLNCSFVTFGPSTFQSNFSRENEETEKDKRSQTKALTGKGRAVT